MPARVRPTEEDGKQSLVEHAAAKAWEAREVYAAGQPQGLSLDALETLLEDRRFVRHPVRLVFDATALQSGEFAIALPDDGDDPAGGYILTVHPSFEGDAATLPMLVAYHLVCVNYGEIAGSEAAEAFGAALMGMKVDDYYLELCKIADSLSSCPSS